MLGKWVTREVADNVDLRDPRDKVKAKLLEIQSQGVPQQARCYCD